MEEEDAPGGAGPLSTGVVVLTCALGLPGNALALWAAVRGVRGARGAAGAVWFAHLALADLLRCAWLPLALAPRAPRAPRTPPRALLPAAWALHAGVCALLLAAMGAHRCLRLARPGWGRRRRSGRAAGAACGAIWAAAFVLCVPELVHRDGPGPEVLDWVLPDSDPPITDAEVLDSVLPDSDPPITDVEVLDSVLPPFARAGLPSIRLLPGPLPPNLPDVYQPDEDDEDPLDGEGARGAGAPPSPSPGLAAVALARLALGWALPAIVLGAVVRAWRGAPLPSGAPRGSLRAALVLLAAFLLCWTPYHAVGALRALGGRPARDGAPAGWAGLAGALAAAHSGLHPVLYALLARGRRRRGLRALPAALRALFTDGDRDARAHDGPRPRGSASTDV